MDLILWRHADAELAAEGQPDEARELTAKGRKQAQKMADWLNRTLPESCKILSSPAVRTVQTAEALDRKFKTTPALAPDATPEEILRAARWPDSKEPVLVIGHQPALGQLAALLIAGSKQDWTIRKGNICWIVRKAEDESETSYIKALLGPELAGK